MLIAFLFFLKALVDLIENMDSGGTPSFVPRGKPMGRKLRVGDNRHENLTMEKLRREILFVLKYLYLPKADRALVENGTYAEIAAKYPDIVDNLIFLQD